MDNFESGLCIRKIIFHFLKWNKGIIWDICIFKNVYVFKYSWNSNTKNKMTRVHNSLSDNSLLAKSMFYGFKIELIEDYVFDYNLI